MPSCDLGPINPFKTNGIFHKVLIQLSQDGPLYILRGLHVIISKNIIFLSLKIDFVIANSADPDEMQPYAVFHLGLHCLFAIVCSSHPYCKMDRE